jgi:hypothetical protein
MVEAVEGRSVRRSEYYRAEAERVQGLADAAEPDRGRERFERVAAEYRSLADYYETSPAAAAPTRSH